MKRIIICLLAITLVFSFVGMCLGENANGTANTAEGYDLLGGVWTVGAVNHDGRIYDVHDIDSLEDLYDNIYLSFHEDGSFIYINMYHSQGLYVPFKENSYLLKRQSLYRFKTTDDGIIKEDIESDKKVTYLVEFVGDKNTLLFGALDPITGKIKADDAPLYLVKDGGESEYIAKHKTQVSGSKASSDRDNKAVTTGEKNALKRAQDYLSILPFSHDGLIEQLEYEGYTHSEATYAADNCNANWNAQAVKKAADYLEIMAFSRSGLIAQLQYDGFTYDQAVYGAEKNGY